MHIDWTERAWLEWSAPDADPGEDGLSPFPSPTFTRVESVRPEPLAKIVRLMLRWDLDTRRSFRVVTEKGLVLNASSLEETVQDGRFPFPVPAMPIPIAPLSPGD